uniref:Zinc finger, RING/FYVE/PHD-type n=1 Tax=Angiostrongylus cantonensis TaxID=6313 RepID=A0A0K0D2N5_ANGCA
MKCFEVTLYVFEAHDISGYSFMSNEKYSRCVLCGDGILTSIETEQYAREGAAKRTLVHFIAKQPTVNLVCNIRVLDCSGCAERSCERHPVLAMLPGVSHSLAYPVVVFKEPHFPLWLLIILLILLLLCCLALFSLAEIAHYFSFPTLCFISTEEVRIFRRQIDMYDSAVPCDRASYRNFAYERDMGRVAPVEGYDEVETRERRFCRSDNEDNDLMERDVKRTHTSTLTHHVVDDDVSSIEERCREEDVHHAVYSQGLPV